MANFRIPLNYKEHVNKAVHNLSCVHRTTAHPMTAIPLYFRKMMPNDTFYFSTPQLLLQSQPTYAPLMGTFRLRVEWYFNSDNNIYGWKDNNDKLSTEETLNRKRHSLKLRTMDDEYAIPFDVQWGENFEATPLSMRQIIDSVPESVKHGSLLDFMGVPVGTIYGDNTMYSNSQFGREINLDYLLCYLNVIRTYHANMQYSAIPFISDRENLDNEIFTEYSIKDMDDLFKMLRNFENGYTFEPRKWTGSVPQAPSEVGRYAMAYYKFLNYLYYINYNSGGLFCTQYEPDLFRNLLNSNLDSVKSVVSTNDDGSFTIEQFRFKNRLQLIIDRIATLGGRRSDVVRGRWGITSGRGRDIPELIAVQSEYIDTNLITSDNAGNNASVGEISPGDMAGNVNQRKFPKGVQKFTATEEGVLMALVTITPLVDYCQGLDRYLTEVNFEDSFSPQMAQRGFESVPKSDYSTLPTAISYDIDQSHARLVLPETSAVVGKQVAWLREMTAVNRTHGEFATGGYYETWVLNRRYTQSPHQPDDMVGVVPNGYMWRGISPYGNPLDWQYPFVAQGIKDANFYLQAAFNVKAVRPVGRRYMPTLGA